MNSFAAAWQAFHGDDQPVGHLMYKYPGWNMTRFHFLPGNRFKAGDNEEKRHLLVRYERMAMDILGEGQPCYMMLLQTVNEHARQTQRLERLRRRHNMTQAMSFFNDDDRLSYVVYACESAWFPQRFTRELIDIYQQRVWDVMWMNKSNGATYRPYDAGAYVSQPTPQDLIDLVSRYYGWLPANGGGFLNFNPAQMRGTRFSVTPACAEAIRKAIGN